MGIVAQRPAVFIQFLCIEITYQGGGFGRIYDHGNRNARRTSECRQCRPRGRKIEIIGKLLCTTDRPIGQVSGFRVYIIIIIIIVIILLFPRS